MYIYEAGCITYYYKTEQKHKAHFWRSEFDIFASDNKIKTFNPAKTFAIEQNHSYNPRLCVDQNDYYINKCDICVVNLDDIMQSPGTIYELTKFKTLGKPVIAFGDKTWSPHINSCISHHCKDLNEVVEVLINMFSQNNF